MRAAASSGVRLAELVATISLGTDLGLGQSMEHILRQTLVSLRMGELLAFDEAEREVAYFSGLLAWVGCHTDAYEQAKWFGDDIALKRDGYHYDMGRPVDVLNFAWHTVGRGRPPLERLKIWLELPLAVRRNTMVDLRNHWLAADELAGRLGLGEPVRRSLRESFERWDGKGFGGARGEEIRLTSRVVCLADVVTAYYEQGGESAAVQVAWQRSGTQFDPALVELFCANAAGVLSGLDGPSQWAQVIDAEPTLARVMTDLEFDAALEAMADFIDLKSPYTLGHSRSVADLSGAAARVLGLPDEDCVGGSTGWPGARPRSAWCAQLDLGQARAADQVGDGTGTAASVSVGADAVLGARPGPARRDRGRAPRADGRIRLSAGAQPRIHQRAGESVGSSRLLCGVNGATATPSAAGTGGGCCRASDRGSPGTPRR